MDEIKLNYLQSLLGMKILIDNNLIVRDEDKVVKRTWFERLFTRPWIPLKKTNRYIQYKPDPNIYTVDNKRIMHEDTFANLRSKVG